MKKELNKGVTLIALIITVIVLLILAGITLAMVMGDNGIIAKAQNAKKVTNDSQKVEETQLAKYKNQIDEISRRNALSKQVVLYENSNPTFTTGDITLNQDIDSYNRFTIYCYINSDDQIVKYFEVYEKGKNVLLDAGYSIGTGYYRDACIVLNLPTTGRIANISRASLEQNGGWYDQCQIGIYKIVGYID